MKIPSRGSEFIGSARTLYNIQFAKNTPIEVQKILSQACPYANMVFDYQINYNVDFFDIGDENKDWLLIGCCCYNAVQMILNVKTLEIYQYSTHSGLFFANTSYKQFLQCAAYIDVFCDEWFLLSQNKLLSATEKANALYEKLSLLRVDLHIADEKAFHYNCFWTLALSTLLDDIDLNLSMQGLEEKLPFESQSGIFFVIDNAKNIEKNSSNDIPF